MEQQIVYVAPEGLLADSNVRFSLKKGRIERLAEEIKAAGEIQTPLNVEILDDPGPDGEQYRIREGHYRQAAALKLNQQGAGIMCPCLIVDPTEGVDRLTRQISENMEREDFSPMDIAVAAKELLQAGMPKVEIRNRFVRAGGRKGTEMKEMSNATLNIYLSFLEFPKAIQTKIHEGLLGVADAYKLTTKPRDQWQAILDQAEEDRIKLFEFEAKLDEKFSADAKKAEEAEAKAKEVEAELEATKAKVAERQKELDEILTRANDAYTTALKTAPKDKEAKKKAEDTHKTLDNDAKVKQKLLDEAEKEAAKLQEKLDKQKTAMEERKRKLDAAKAGASKKPLNIDKAAQKVTGTGVVAPTATEIRKGIADNALPGSFPKTREVFQSMAKMCSGLTTPSQCLSEIAYLMGERKDRPKTLPKEVKEVAAKA